MDTCHNPRPFARRPFIITPYALSEREGFVQVLPLECLMREQVRSRGSSGTGPPLLSGTEWASSSLSEGGATDG